MSSRRQKKHQGRGRDGAGIALKITAVVLVALAIFAVSYKFVYPRFIDKKEETGNEVSQGNGANQGDKGNQGNDTIDNAGENPDNKDDETEDGSVGNSDNDSNEEGDDDTSIPTDNTGTAANEDIAGILKEADRIAAGYDYDKAIKMLSDIEGYEAMEDITALIKEYETKKEALVPWEDVTKISHVFFHTMIVDTAKAFDGDYKQDGYNEVMTTVDEFNKIMEQMYERGYVLISIHDMANFEKGEDGSEKFTKGKIMLPEGKIPFVLSQDDVSYYEYMEGDGFATRLVIGDDGMVTNEMELDDGSVVRGSYDMVPLLEDFIKEHPDFSYRGARGILALTGYNGVLGYRTSPTEYADSPTLKEDIETATKVADRLKEMGWEFASHSWGHRDLGRIPYKDFVRDTDRWEAEVRPILGDTDVLIFPFGSDVGSWTPYKGERYEYLKSKGFVYFCNVDAAGPYWVQITGEYLRQGRINLDGMRMYEAISGGRNRVEPFFDVDYVFDKARPLPVPGI